MAFSDLCALSTSVDSRIVVNLKPPWPQVPSDKEVSAGKLKKAEHQLRI